MDRFLDDKGIGNIFLFEFYAKNTNCWLHTIDSQFISSLFWYFVDFKIEKNKIIANLSSYYVNNMLEVEKIHPKINYGTN